ncbi:hypothetical protein J6590_016493 [Homalodisca vitripennis]|nr:hypothetical protein J6590_016493 [Homalodisca vitripennis]
MLCRMPGISLQINKSKSNCRPEKTSHNSSSCAHLPTSTRAVTCSCNCPSSSHQSAVHFTSSSSSNLSLNYISDKQLFLRMCSVQFVFFEACRTPTEDSRGSTFALFCFRVYYARLTSRLKNVREKSTNITPDFMSQVCGSVRFQALH